MADGTGPQLRPYQEACVDGLREAIRAGYRAPLLVSPTGSGKTVMFSHLAHRISGAGKRTVVIAHRDELVEQISLALRFERLQHGVISAQSRHYDFRLRTHVASVQTLVRRIEQIAPPDYLIIDEAHHCVLGTTWGKVVARWLEKRPSMRVIGVTATPERLSGEGLGQVFDRMVLGPSTADLIAAGWLSKYRLFAPPPRDAVDFSDVHSRGGDFVRSEVAGKIDKPTITGSALAQYRKHCDGAPAVAFCTSIEHAVHVAETFAAAGYRAASIDGTMDKDERRRIVASFRSGALSVLTAADLISEGFDVPGIVAGILLRPTQSLALHLQQVGRCLRIAPGKECAYILDHVGNWERHGLPDDEREWTLAGRDRKARKAKDPDDVVVKQCPSCYAISRALATRCSACGQVFPVKARKVAEVEGELQEIDASTVRRPVSEFAMSRQAARDLEALVKIGQARGMGNPEGWARHVLEAREAKRRRA